MVHLLVRNDSRYKGLYRTDNLLRLADRVYRGEGFEQEAELSLLFCDNAFITTLNQTYRQRRGPTDVLSFGQTPDPVAPPRPLLVLGDIVISLEMVQAGCEGNRAAMRNEIRLLFCHGLLHLLGIHHGTARERRDMAMKQSQYLGIAPGAAWRGASPTVPGCSRDCAAADTED